jgi:hypothetical protein
LDNIKDLDKEMKEIIVDALKKEKEKQWDDYGRIDSVNMRNIFNRLGNQISSNNPPAEPVDLGSPLEGGYELNSNM